MIELQRKLRLRIDKPAEGGIDTKYRAYHEVVFGGESALVAEVDTVEGITRPVLVGDLDYPTRRNRFFERHFGETSDCGRFKIDTSGYSERILDPAKANPQLKRFVRYRAAPEVTLTRVFFQAHELVPYVAANDRRWQKRLGYPEFDCASLFVQAIDWEHGIFFSVWVEGTRMAIAHCEGDGQYLHWVNTYWLQEPPSRAGNNHLLALLGEAVGRGLLLNLGSDFFPYKKLWTETTIQLPGISYASAKA